MRWQSLHEVYSLLELLYPDFSPHLSKPCAGEQGRVQIPSSFPSASEAPQACEKCGSTRMRESAEHPLICDRCVAALAGEF
ncbi:MAG: hypothetical protein V7K57_06820 [Nostoc sp.]|uniref:hypothetical protein n=1 Tax=Nostoc sp. TaxID=1180 RepID=UPI002FFA3A1A